MSLTTMFHVLSPLLQALEDRENSEQLCVLDGVYVYTSVVVWQHGQRTSQTFYYLCDDLFNNRLWDLINFDFCTDTRTFRAPQLSTLPGLLVIEYSFGWE